MKITYSIEIETASNRELERCCRLIERLRKEYED
jgi:hypothetical protein